MPEARNHTSIVPPSALGPAPQNGVASVDAAKDTLRVDLQFEVEDDFSYQLNFSKTITPINVYGPTQATNSLNISTAVRYSFMDGGATLDATASYQSTPAGEQFSYGVKALYAPNGGNVTIRADYTIKHANLNDKSTAAQSLNLSGRVGSETGPNAAAEVSIASDNAGSQQKLSLSLTKMPVGSHTYVSGIVRFNNNTGNVGHTSSTMVGATLTTSDKGFRADFTGVVTSENANGITKETTHIAIQGEIGPATIKGGYHHATTGGEDFTKAGGTASYQKFSVSYLTTEGVVGGPRTLGFGGPQAQGAPPSTEAMGFTYGNNYDPFKTNAGEASLYNPMGVNSTSSKNPLGSRLGLTGGALNLKGLQSASESPNQAKPSAARTTGVELNGVALQSTVQQGTLDTTEQLGVATNVRLGPIVVDAQHVSSSITKHDDQETHTSTTKVTATGDIGATRVVARYSNTNGMDSFGFTSQTAIAPNAEVVMGASGDAKGSSIYVGVRGDAALGPYATPTLEYQAAAGFVNGDPQLFASMKATDGDVSVTVGGALGKQSTGLNAEVMVDAGGGMTAGAYLRTETKRDDVLPAFKYADVGQDALFTSITPLSTGGTQAGVRVEGKF